MYSREERTRLTGEINDTSAFIPGAERYFRRLLHVKNCRDRLIISSGFQEKGGCLLIRACSVITSNTVCCFYSRVLESYDCRTKFNSSLGMEYNGELYGFSAVKVKLVDSLI